MKNINEEETKRFASYGVVKYRHGRRVIPIEYGSNVKTLLGYIEKILLEEEGKKKDAGDWRLHGDCYVANSYLKNNLLSLLNNIASFIMREYNEGEKFQGDGVHKVGQIFLADGTPAETVDFFLKKEKVFSIGDGNFELILYSSFRNEEIKKDILARYRSLRLEVYMVKKNNKVDVIRVF